MMMGVHGALAACVLALAADSIPAATFKGWEIAVKSVKRPGPTYALYAGLAQFTARPGEEVLVVTLSFRSLANAEELRGTWTLLGADGKEMGSLGEWFLQPGPKASTKTNDQDLPFSIPKGASVKSVSLGDKLSLALAESKRP